MKPTGKNHPLEETVSRVIAAAEFPSGAQLVVGVSGGPDSTALLAALASIASGGRLGLTACMVDHGIRSRQEIDGDADFTRGLAGFLGVPFRLLAVPKGECAAQARGQKKSLEEVARERRLDLLSRLAVELRAAGIVLGHTRDDQVETLLMRVLQGSGARGLSGIAVKRGLFLRPMLSVSRREVLRYLRSKNLGYRVDSTNADTRILRNRVRSFLIPALERVLPGFRKGLLSMAQKISFFDDYIEEEASSRLVWEREGGRFSIPMEVFFSAPPALRACSLFSLFDLSRGAEESRRLPFRFLLPVLGDTPPEGALLLKGHGLLLRRRGRSLLWERDIVTEGEKSYFISVETGVKYSISGTEVRVSRALGIRKAGVAGFEINARGIVTPLVLRSKRKGDEILLACGRKPVKDLFSEWKVPTGERAEIPILADRRGLVAVLGAVRGFPTRVRFDKPDSDGGIDITVSILKKGD